MRAIRNLAMLLALAVLGLSAGALAMSSKSSDSGKGANPAFADGVKAIEASQWQAAISSLETAVETDAKNADAHNYLGYAHRKLGNLEKAFEHYAMALSIDPEHRAAHEYVGEAHLMAGNLAKAEEHLKVLDGLCAFGCDEYYALKDAVAAYRAKTGG